MTCTLLPVLAAVGRLLENRNSAWTGSDFRDLWPCPVQTGAVVPCVRFHAKRVTRPSWSSYRDCWRVFVGGGIQYRTNLRLQCLGSRLTERGRDHLVLISMSNGQKCCLFLWAENSKSDHRIESSLLASVAASQPMLLLQWWTYRLVFLPFCQTEGMAPIANLFRRPSTPEIIGWLGCQNFKMVATRDGILVRHHIRRVLLFVQYPRSADKDSIQHQIDSPLISQW